MSPRRRAAPGWREERRVPSRVHCGRPGEHESEGKGGALEEAGRERGAVSERACAVRSTRGGGGDARAARWKTTRPPRR